MWAWKTVWKSIPLISCSPQKSNTVFSTPHWYHRTTLNYTAKPLLKHPTPHTSKQSPQPFSAKTQEHRHTPQQKKPHPSTTRQPLECPHMHIQIEPIHVLRLLLLLLHPLPLDTPKSHVQNGHLAKLTIDEPLLDLFSFIENGCEVTFRRADDAILAAFPGLVLFRAVLRLLPRLYDCL